MECRAEGRSVAQESQRDELKRLDRKIGNLVSVLAESGGSAAILTALKDAEARKATLEAELAATDAPSPRLMQIWRSCIASGWRRCRRH